jgi:hypothetical protein
LTSNDSRAQENKTINLNPEKGVFIPLHIKLYFMKCFEDYESNSHDFVYLEHIFPTMSKVKIKEAVFVGIHIRETVKHSSLDDTLSEAEGAAWTEFRAVTTNVYENFKAKNYA